MVARRKERQARRKEHATRGVASEDLRNFKERSKENKVTVQNRTTRKTFLLFCFRIAYYQKCVPYFQATTNTRLPWVRVSNEQST